MEWNEKLKTGNDLIDSQHKEIFEKINELKAAMEWHTEAEETLALVAFLEEYALTHFSGEETIMKEQGYPGLAAHKEAHESFVDDFEGLKDDIYRNGPSMDLALNMHTWLTEWLSEHILKTDMELIRFLETRNRPGGSPETK
ncbi:MAG: hemerythrin family protein [Thermodesulfobacteriota bacterium]